jgi:hypothetical protein
VLIFAFFLTRRDETFVFDAKGKNSDQSDMTAFKSTLSHYDVVFGLQIFYSQFHFRSISILFNETLSDKPKTELVFSISRAKLQCGEN